VKDAPIGLLDANDVGVDDDRKVIGDAV